MTWQQLAWVLGAQDLGQDVPTADDDTEDAVDFREWAELRFGPMARQCLAVAHVVMTGRLP